MRVIHIEEVNYGNGTEDVEMKLEGSGPWNIGSDVDLIFTPGHTEVIKGGFLLSCRNIVV